MKNLWNKIVDWLLGLPNNVLLAFIGGLILASFITIVVPSFAEWCIVPAMFACIVGIFIQDWRGRKISWATWGAITLGALIIQIFAWL